MMQAAARRTFAAACNQRMISSKGQYPASVGPVRPTPFTRRALSGPCLEARDGSSLVHVRDRHREQLSDDQERQRLASTRWRSAATTRTGGEISSSCRNSTSATCATGRRSTASGSATAGMTGAFRTRHSACSRPSTSSPSSIFAISGCRTGSAISRTPTSRPCSPSMPAPLRSGFHGCSSIRP